MDKIKQNKLNSMLDESLSKETAENWNKRLQEEPEPQFKVGDTIRSKVWESAVHKIIYVDDSAYFFENGDMVRFANQEQWELVEKSVSDGLEEAAKKAATQIVRGEEKFFLNDYHKFKAGAEWQRKQDMQKFLHSEVATFTREEFDAEIAKAKQEGIEIGKAEIMSKVKKLLDKVDIDSDDCYEQVNDCYDNLCEMKANEQRPGCGDCSHLREKAVSDVSSVLWCDIPNENRKESRDVGGCENYKRKEE